SIHIEIPKGSYIPTFLSDAADPTAPDFLIPGHNETPSAAFGAPAIVRASRNDRRAISKRHIAYAMGVLAAALLAWLGIAWFGLDPPFFMQRQQASVGNRPAIFVTLFGNDGGEAVDAALVRGFTRDVIVGLTRCDGLFVFGPETSFRHGPVTGPSPSADDLPVESVLTGGITVAENRFRVAVSLIDARTGRNL